MSDLTGLNTVLQGMEAYVAALREQAQKAADEIAKLLEAYAKTHHIWKPETGATDASIKGQVAEVSNEMVLITLSAGMDYDVFLELAHDGKWAWLWPAVVDNKDRIQQILVKWLGSGGTHGVEAFE